jgi:hypothetical protein
MCDSQSVKVSLAISAAAYLLAYPGNAFAAGGEIGFASGLILWVLVAGLPSYCLGWFAAKFRPIFSVAAAALFIVASWAVIVAEKGFFGGLSYVVVPVVILLMMSPFLAAGWFFSLRGARPRHQVHEAQ